MDFQENKLFIITIAVIVIGLFGYILVKPDSAQTSVKSQKSVQKLEMSSAYTKGDANARVKLVQYSDFLCPSCAQVSLGIMPEIEEKYIDTGKVDFEFRPMAFIAAGSQTAAEGAYCAADQGKFWEYHDAAYQAVWQGYFSKGVDPSQVPLYSQSGVVDIATAAGLDSTALVTCLADGTNTNAVKAFTNKAQAAGVNGTPYFEVNGRAINGAPTLDVLEAALKAAGA